MSINPKTLDPEDYVAYLIGRIMIEWGELDQRLYSDIGRFDLKMRQTVATYTDDLDRSSIRTPPEALAQTLFSIVQG